MFKVGDYVVYKKDVCKIIRMKEKDAAKFYVLNPIDDDSLTITVDCNNEYLRNIISHQEAEEIILSIPNIDIIDVNDKMIESEYKKLLYSGSHYDLIKVIKTTYTRNDLRLKSGKKTVDKDKDYFEKAEKYLYNELSLALGMSFLECKEYIINKVSEIDK